MPSIRTARRPKRSESGPITNWPTPKPIRNVDSTACGRLAIVMWNAEAMFGSAGSIMSIASGFRAMIEAITMTNSGNPIGRWVDETQVSALISVTLRTSLETQFYRLCCAATTHVPGWLVRCQRVAQIGKPAYRTRGLSRSAQFFRGSHAGVICILGPHLGDDAIDLVLRLGKCLSRLPGELIGRADGRSEHRGDRPSEPRHIFRRSYGGNAESETGQKRRFEKCGSCRDGDNGRRGLVDPAIFSSAVSWPSCSRPSCTSGLSLAGASVRPFWVGSSSSSLSRPSSESDFPPSILPPSIKARRGSDITGITVVAMTAAAKLS